MANLREKLPGEWSDDERWYRIFTNKMILTVGAGAVLTFLLDKLFSLFGLELFGLIAGVLITAVSFVLVSVPLPTSSPFYDGGITLDRVLIRKMTRLKNRIKYVGR